MSPREGWLLTGLAVIACGTAAFMSADWDTRQGDRYALATADLANARQLHAQTDEIAASAPEPGVIEDISARSVQAGDIWMARLAIEQRLLKAAEAAHVVNPEVTVAEGVEGDARAPVLRAELSGAWAGASVPALLKAISADQPAPFVQSLNLTSTPTPEFKLAVDYLVDTSGVAP